MRALNLKEAAVAIATRGCRTRTGLFSMRLNTLLAFGLGEGMTDLCRGQEAFIRALYQFHQGRARELDLPFEPYMAKRAAPKGRQFNTILNHPELEEERKALEKKRQAEPYRKASDRE